MALSTSDNHSPLFTEYLELLGGNVDLQTPSPGPFGPDDALLVIDMQCDFVPKSATNPHGGHFGVPEGDLIVDSIVTLMTLATRAGATVCATRDYHPFDHVSFNTCGGPFPVHCVQGSPGSKFLPPIAEALAAGVRKVGNEKVFVAFKAMHEEIDSFGALPYLDGGKDRISRTGTLATECEPCECPMGCTAAPWTGSLLLKQSNMLHTANGIIDMDAPPDVLATTADGVDRKLRNLQDALKDKKRIFVCGLALDFCVLDTCLNGKLSPELSSAQILMIYDAARAAHLPGIGQYGSGFLQDPAEILRKVRTAGVGVVSVAQLDSGRHETDSATELSSYSRTRTLKPKRVSKIRGSGIFQSTRLGPRGFPYHLGPLGLKAAHINATFNAAENTYSLKMDGPLAALAKLGVKNLGVTSPPAPLPRRWPMAPLGAAQLVWAYPVDGIAELRGSIGKSNWANAQAQLTFLSLTTSTELGFAAYGGFLLLDTQGQVLCSQAVVDGDAMMFGNQCNDVPEGCIESLKKLGRLRQVTLPSLLGAGAKEFCWLQPNEKIQLADGSGRSFTPSETGCFIYTQADAPPVYFPVTPPAAPHVAFITDVEGNWEYFLSFVEQSAALSLRGILTDGSADVEIQDGWQLVFGGDAVDKGGKVGGSVRFVVTMLRLKRKYGDRVTIILGNRDLNKMRITSELADEEELSWERLADVPGPYWVPPAKNEGGPKKYIEARITKQKGKTGNADEVVPVPTDEELRAENTAFNRLKWMLEKTFGAAGEEERRRAELAVMEPDGVPISDEEVVASFVESVQPGGWMREYLKVGVLAAVIEGSLYVHGGIVGSFSDGSTDNLGCIPGMSERVADVNTWVNQLNAWKSAQIANWELQPTYTKRPTCPEDFTDDCRGGQAIMNYVTGGVGCGPSVISGRHLDKSGMPKPLEPELCKRLKAVGIHRLVLGHTPHGNCPTIIQSGEADNGTSFVIVMADTSYSDMKATDNRGSGCSTVNVMNDGCIYVTGVLPTLAGEEPPDWSGKQIMYTIPADPAQNELEVVGRVEPEQCLTVVEGGDPPHRRFVKARFAAGDQVLMCHVSGFLVEYSIITTSEARDMFQMQTPKSVNRMSSWYTSFGDEVHIGHDEVLMCKRLLVERLFSEIDTDGSGTLELGELDNALSMQPEIVKLLAGTGNLQPPAWQLLDAMDTDKQGTVSREEFVSYFIGGSPLLRSPLGFSQLPPAPLPPPTGPAAAIPPRMRCFFNCLSHLPHSA